MDNESKPEQPGAAEKKSALEQLPPKQQLFVLCLSADPKRNGTKAVQRVWKQTDAAAAVTASRLLKKAKVKAALDEELAKQAAGLRKDGEYVLRRMFEAEGFNLRDLYDEFGHVKPMSQWPENAGTILESIRSTIEPQYDLFKRRQDGKPEQVERIEISLPSRKELWKLLGQHFGLFKTEIDLNVKGDLAARLASARKRVQK